MVSRNRTWLFVAVAAAGLLFAGVQAATAQSDAALRRENDALRAQVKDLQNELDAARKQIGELEEMVKRLEAQIRRMEAGGGTGPKPAGELPPEKVTIDESKPDASPRALLKALQDDYKQAMSDREKGAPNSADRSAYITAVERWARAANRQYRGPIEWHAVVQQAEPGPRGTATVALTLQAVDPVTEVALGDPFPAAVDNRTLIRRIDDLARAGRLIDQTFVIKGILEPEVRVNPNREAAGTFNNPPLIGSFAEFRFYVDVRALQEPKQEDTPEREPQPKTNR